MSMFHAVNISLTRRITVPGAQICLYHMTSEMLFYFHEAKLLCEKCGMN
jgi:hypothetical protein